MSELQRAGQGGALDVATSQAAAKEQIATMLDMLRQLGGNPSVVAGAGGSADPLNAPFTLYVDPYIGSDRFVGGAYNSHEATGSDEQIIAQKLKRIELQRLECGYSASRPFRTINRAAIEAAIITSKNWYAYSDPRAHVDCVTIVLSGGVHIVLNDPGSSSTNLASWGTTKDPTNAELIAFNPTTGGVLLPRGCSMHGQDLRKTSVRPNWVTAVVDELPDYSNRRAIFKVSGTGFFFNATTMDKIGHTESVHLLDTFHPASQAELNAFYLKVQSSVGTGADLATALLAARPSEYQIVGPIDQAQSPTSAWDTTTGASPYIFNWTSRSEYGMGGAFWDGAKIAGLKSMVCANFTGTNQQKDMRCWQVYQGGAWVTLPNTPDGYQQYINAAPDNLRRNPARQSRHICAINNAYIQKVSVFGIGQSEVTMVDSGGEITDNGGNSTFGGSSALAKGYKGFAFGKDKNWTVGNVRVPLNISEKISNIRRIDLGVVEAISSSAITLSSGLAINSETPANPALLESLGYSLAAGTRIWISNPEGDDWRATLSSNAWNSTTPAAIGITAAPLQSGTNAAAGNAVIGCRVYLRRVVDTRTVAERRVSLLLNNTASARLPQRNTVLQTDPARPGGAISRVLATGGEEVLIVTNAGAGATPGSGVLKTAEISLRRGAASKTYASGVFYRQGTIVKHAGKHWQAVRTFISSGPSPDPLFWGETFVHMPSDFNPEDSVSHEAPILIIDTDESDTAGSTTLGINWTTEWTTAGPTRDQYRSSTDYLGCYAFLRALGFSDAAAHSALVPQVAASRDRDPSSSAAFPTAPSGGAATGRGNWAVEFRRPSTLRLYNHQWEWAGFGNYSKAMPAVQGDMSEFNKFTYYFTSAAGGRVVPKGSNEDGFEVSPRGLEDIATGATIPPESVGGQNIDEAQRTDFPNGLVASEIEVGTLRVTGSIEFPALSHAAVDRIGIVQLADAADYRSTASISGTTDAARNASIDAEPNVVTAKGLNYWKNENRLISARTGTQFIYVDPVNGRNISNINTLFSAPPVTQSGADSSSNRAGVAVRSLAAAANYANQAFGPTTTVEFRCGPGVYLDDGAITFSTIARIRAWDYSANAYLNDKLDGGTVAFAAGNFRNTAAQPIFLTKPGYGNSFDFGYTTARPLHFIFKEAGQVTGVVWWGIMDSITQSSVPDSFFASGGISTAANSGSPTNWRALAKADNDNALNYYVREHVMKAAIPGKLSGHRGAPFLSFEKTGEINNVSLGAVCPADRFITFQPRTLDTVIRQGSQLVEISGLRLVGNCNFSSAVNTGEFSAIRYRSGNYTAATYQYTGFAVFLIGAREEVADSITVRFGTAGIADDDSYNDGAANYNHLWNHVSLLNNNLEVASGTGSASGSGWKTIGPSLESIIGQINGTRSNTSRNWTQWRIAPNSSGGFLGKFGLHDSATSTDNRTQGALEPLSLYSFGLDTPGTIFRVAGTGELPAVSYTGLNPGDIGAFVNFDALNMRVRPYQQGVDITTGRFHERQFAL